MNDDELLRELGRVLDAAEPVPAPSTVLAEAALGWRTLDAELAELVHDSAVEQGELVLRGAGPAQRILTFATEAVQVDIEVAEGQLVGQVTPPTAATVELRRGDDQPAVVTATDEFGAFVVDRPGRGPATIVCRAADGSWAVRTSWTAL